MRRLFLLLPLVLCLSVWVARLTARPTTAYADSGVAVSSTKHALIVAVGAYPEASGWMSISSLNDVTLIKTALRQQGFEEANIRVLTDAAATKAGIVAALEGMAKRVKPNDVVVFHYSGHGQQVVDDNGDESDGLDEALVPYDAPKDFTPGKYEGQNHLRDDLLGTLLGNIRTRAGAGGEVLAILDACHSGTGTRGLARARGTREPLAPPGFAPAKSLATSCATGDCSFGVNEGNSRGATAQAPLVCYFGASPSQLNFETFDAKGNGVGSLSLAFSEALTTAPAGPTYAGLFDRIKANMASTAPNQTPQMEGQTNARLFRGQTVTLPKHYKTTSWLTDQTVLIDGGSLHGLYQGTELALYPPDTDVKPGTPALATGKINLSELGTSTLTLDRPIRGPSRAAWAVVTNRKFGSMAARLRVNLPAGSLREQVLAAVRERPFTQLVTDPNAPVDALLEMDRKTGALSLLSSQDQSLYSSTTFQANPAGAATEIMDKITALAQTKYIRALSPRAEALDVQLTVVPVTVKMEGAYKKVDKVLDPASKRDATGNLVYYAEDHVQLEVTNKGRKTAYFTVLDIQPDNQMSVMVPRPDEVASDYVLEPGQTLRLPRIFKITPPYGEEMFKAIAAEKPLDLRGVVGTRGARGAGDGNPFSTLISHTYKDGEMQHRGSETDAVQPETVNVHNLTFRIAERNKP